MAITLNTPFTIPNGTRLEFPKIASGSFDDEAGVWTVQIELRKSVPNGAGLIARTVIHIRDGACTQLTRQASPPAGLNIDDPLVYFVVVGRNVATGYTDAALALKNAANTPAARRTALEAHLFSAGHIDSSLAGT